MKTDKLFVIVEAEDGNFYQIVLNEQEMRVIMSTISYMHDGNVKCFESTLPLSVEKTSVKKPKKKKKQPSKKKK